MASVPKVSRWARACEAIPVRTSITVAGIYSIAGRRAPPGPWIMTGHLCPIDRRDEQPSSLLGCQQGGRARVMLRSAGLGCGRPFINGLRSNAISQQDIKRSFTRTCRARQTLTQTNIFERIQIIRRLCIAWLCPRLAGDEYNNDLQARAIKAYDFRHLFDYPNRIGTCSISWNGLRMRARICARSAGTFSRCPRHSG